MSDSKNLAPKDNKDFVPRGNKKSSPLNTSLFLGLRTVDIFVQYGILAHGFGGGLIRFLGGSTIPQGPALNSGIAFLDSLNLSPYRLAILTMVSMTTLKHIWFVMCVAEEAWTVSGAIIVAVFNTFWNSTNSLLFLCAATSAAASGEVTNTNLVLGVSMFTIGIVVETLAEMQRLAFKKKAINKGKCYTEGLFGIVRHINYSGYSLWRAGTGLACCGWTWSAIVYAFFIYDFSTRAIPALNEYCEKRVSFPKGHVWDLG
jgi:protein-S-isoprenylcysteine O-methyltransferase Ste14